MLKRSKIAVALTAALLCAMPMAVSAADEKEPVVIVTDKSEYAGTDEVKESIVITNTTGAEATNVTVKVDVPKGLMEKGTKIEEQIVKQYEKLAAGESTQLDITLVKSTQSGDSAKVLLWVGLAAVGVAGFVALSRKKNLKGAMSVLMVVAMVATLVPANPQNVEAASTTKKATKEITVAGEKVKLSVSVVFNDERLLTLGANMLKNASGSNLGGWSNGSAVASGHKMTVNNGVIEYAITDVGEHDYDIQLKQMGLKLEKDATYVVSFDAKSTETRKIKASVMNGTYEWYGGADNGNGAVLEKGKTEHVEFEFTMKVDEANAGLYLSLGQIFDETYDENGKLVSSTKVDTPASTITLSNFKFAKKVPAEYTATAPVTVTIPAKDETTSSDTAVTNVNMLENVEFDGKADEWSTKAINPPATGTVTFGDGKITFDITNAGENDWDAQLIQTGLDLENGAKYEVSFKAVSTAARTILANVMSCDGNYTWYGGAKQGTEEDAPAGVVLEKDVVKDVKFELTMNADDSNGGLYISMGKVGDSTPASKITLSDFKFVKVEEPKTEEPSTGGDTTTPGDDTTTPGDDTTTPGDGEEDANMFKDPNFTKVEWNPWGGYVNSPAESTEKFVALGDGAVKIKLDSTGSAPSDAQFQQSGVALGKGAEYKVSFKITSTEARLIKTGVQNASYVAYGASDVELQKDVEKLVEYTFTSNADDDNATFYVALGKYAADKDTPASTITMSDFKMIKVTGEVEEDSKVEVNLLKDPNFTKVEWNPWGGYVSSPAESIEEFVALGDGAVKIKLDSTGSAPSDAQFQQSGVALEKDAEYKVSFKITSTEARSIKTGVQNASYVAYGASDVELQKDVEKLVEYTFTSNADDDNATFYVALGKYAADKDTPASTITMSDFKIVKVEK